MLAKIYWLINAVSLLAFAIVAVTGNMTMMAWVVFGFLAFGLIFLGLISVLPVVLTHPEPERPVKAAAPAAVPAAAEHYAVLETAR